MFSRIGLAAVLAVAGVLATSQQASAHGPFWGPRVAYRPYVPVYVPAVPVYRPPVYTYRRVVTRVPAATVYRPPVVYHGAVVQRRTTYYRAYPSYRSGVTIRVGY
ncbi:MULTISPECIES: hypothetical protein [Crateriforma]|uniref:Uncharacterized protein n=1 Tax=Crateriforma conspicua TaxID=2527996 RepID=A0A5C6FSC5_9PLAN|nr:MULTISPECIES: hypothetical protein [Crateriforma]TWU63423.1 hypothetical protein V7x_51630 [Crateriforma conspicua]